MALIRQIGQHFRAYQVEPKTTIRSTGQLFSGAYSTPEQTSHKRRELDRRCHRDRRQKQLPVLMNMRSPYSRRTNGRRSKDSGYVETGIDVYA